MNFLRPAAIVGAVILATVAAAQTTLPVVTVTCIVSGGLGCTTALNATDLTGQPLVSVAGHTTPGDGGGGDFYLNGTSCTEDGGTIIKDGASPTKNCFYRRFTGTVYMSWFGAQTGQDMATSADCTPSGNCFTNAFAAAATPSGNNTVSTGGIFLFSSAYVTPLANQTLTCEASYTAGQALSNYSSVRGAIVVGHLASIKFTMDNDEFHHCIVLTNGAGNGGAAINLAPASQRNALTNDANMIANGDVGVFCDNPENNYIHDVTVIGFDTGVAAWQCSRFRMDHVDIDADVAVYLQSLKSPPFLTNVNVKNFLSQNVSGADVPYPQITSITNNGAGLCRVSLSVSTNIQSNDWVSLSGDKTPADMGPLSCYGTFQAQFVSASTIDLAGTKWGQDFTSPFATNLTGSWLINSSIINVSSVAGIEAGQCIVATDSLDGSFNSYTCTDSLGSHSNSVMVKDVSYYSKKVVIANGNGTPAYTKSASTDASRLSISNYGAYVANSTLYLYATSHIAAGNSIGGAASGNVATSVMAGGPGDTSPLGFIGSNFYTFGHRRQYNFASAGPALCGNCAFDTQAELFDIKQIGARFGHGVSPLPLTASTTINSPTVTISTLSPAYSGWRKFDTVISSSGDINGQTIQNPVNEGDMTITLNGNASASHTGETIYDVNPLILTGNTSAGSETITGLSHDPTGSWHVGDEILTPVATPAAAGDIPYGSHIVAITSCPPCSVTVDTASLGTHTGAPVADSQARGFQNTASADFVGSNLGGGGGFVFDSLSTGCNSVQGVTIQVNNPGQPALEAVEGCMLLTNVSTPQPNDFMIDASIANVLMSGSQTTRAGIFFEGSSVASLFTGAGNVMGGGGSSNLTAFGDTSLCGTLDKTSSTVPLSLCSGAIVNGNATGGSQGEGTDNVSGGYFYNGVSVGINSSSHNDLAALPGATATTVSAGFMATLVGNDNVGRVTVGSLPSTTVVLTFGSAWSHSPICTATNETSLSRNPILTSSVTATTVTFTANTTLHGGDKVSYNCAGYK